MKRVWAWVSRPFTFVVPPGLARPDGWSPIRPASAGMGAVAPRTLPASPRPGRMCGVPGRPWMVAAPGVLGPDSCGPHTQPEGARRLRASPPHPHTPLCYMVRSRGNVHIYLMLVDGAVHGVAAAARGAGGCSSCDARRSGARLEQAISRTPRRGRAATVGRRCTRNWRSGCQVRQPTRVALRELQ